MERRHAEPWLQTRAAAPELLPSTFRAGRGGHAAEMSQWLRSQHSQAATLRTPTPPWGCSQRALHVGRLLTEEPSLHTRGASTEDGHLLPFSADGEQMAARARTLVPGSSSALTC